MTVADSIRISESNGLTCLHIDNGFATATVSLFGAHVLSFIPKSDGQERLWVSPHAYLNGERPIRGGIPICWPWFSHDHGKEKGALPSHGFLRTQVWQVTESFDDSEGTHISLAPSFSRAEGFEYDCSVALDIVVGEKLTVALKTTNTGLIPFTFNCALHTYFHIEHIKNTYLEGITGDYKDKLDGWAVKATPSPYGFTSETDRIHVAPIAQATILMNDKPFTMIGSENNDSLVVWNPWQSAASIADMDPFGYKHMLCVEAAVTQGKYLQPNESHTLIQRVAPL